MGSERKNLSLEIFRRSLAPFMFFLMIVWCYVYYQGHIRAVLHPGTRSAISKVFFVVFSVVVIFYVGRLAGCVLSWYKSSVADRTETTLDDEFFPLLSKTSSVLVWTIGLLVVLSKLGLNINALIATLGVGSLAIALAAQDTIANIISGFLLMVDRPFKIDDTIKIPSGEKVKVMDIGVRRSKFLAEDGSVIIIPNVDISKAKIINYTHKMAIKS